jgi:hypothetical protein
VDSILLKYLTGLVRFSALVPVQLAMLSVPVPNIDQLFKMLVLVHSLPVSVSLAMPSVPVPVQNIDSIFLNYSMILVCFSIPVLALLAMLSVLVPHVDQKSFFLCISYLTFSDLDTFFIEFSFYLAIASLSFGRNESGSWPSLDLISSGCSVKRTGSGPLRPPGPISSPPLRLRCCPPAPAGP